MEQYRLLFTASCVEAFAKLSRQSRTSLLEKLDFLGKYPLQPDATLTSPDSSVLDLVTIGAWTLAYSVDFPAKTIIVTRFTRIARNPRRD